MVAGAAIFIFCIIFFYLTAMTQGLIKCCSDDICKYTTGCYFRTCTCTFYNQGLVGITIGIKQYDIILAVQMIEIMLR